MNFRPMLDEDVDAVRRVDTLAFTPQFNKVNAARNAVGEFPLRTRENILSARAIFPQGCFVAEEGGALAGYVFSRAWGVVGWVGVFGIHPAFQGQRVGQRLLALAVDALRAAGCLSIGLETMPDSYYNVGLYMRQGFRPVHLTMALQKPVQAGSSTGDCRVLAAGDQPGLDAVSCVSQAAWEWLDLRAEALNAMRYGWGQSVLVGADQPYAAAVGRVVNRREGGPNDLFEITSLAGLPDARSRLASMFNSLEDFAAQQGFASMRLIVNSADWESLQALLALGYRVAHTALRMVLIGQQKEYPGLVFTRWGM